MSNHRRGWSGKYAVDFLGRELCQHFHIHGEHHYRTLHQGITPITLLLLPTTTVKTSTFAKLATRRLSSSYCLFNHLDKGMGDTCVVDSQHVSNALVRRSHCTYSKRIDRLTAQVAF